MKKLIFIGGTTAVGKTTTLWELQKELPRTAFLDADWCWTQGPDWNRSDENVKMAEENMSFLLNNFLKNPNFDNVIFTWVLNRKDTHDNLLKSLKYPFKLYNFSLIANEQTIRARRESRNQKRGGEISDIEFENQVAQSMKRMADYKDLDTTKIDVSTLTPKQICTEIIRIAELNKASPISHILDRARNAKKGNY